MIPPPRFFRWLLGRLVHPGNREHFLADLDDGFTLRVSRDGARSASRWYWRQTLMSVLPLARYRIAQPAVVGTPIQHDGGGAVWHDFIDDLRHAFRLSRRNPLETSTIIATMILGIGVTTAVFSVVNGVLLRPLPFDGSERVIQLGMTMRDGRSISSMAYPDVQDLKRLSRSFAGFSAAAVDGLTLTQGANPQRLVAARVDEDYARVFAIRPALGRFFVGDEFRPGSPKVVVLADGIWRQQFGGDLSIVGRTISLQNEPYRVVGVLPPMAFVFPRATVQLLVPLIPMPGSYENNRGAMWIDAVVAKAKPGISIAKAGAEVVTIGEALAAQYPDANGGLHVRYESLQDAVVGEVRPMLILLSASVAAVLLIACVNIANLLLGQAQMRGREFAVRAALGGSGARIRRQLLTEGMFWASIGGVVGATLAPLLTHTLIALYPGNMPRIHDVGTDWRVVTMAVLATLVAGLLSAIPMVRRAAARDLTVDLKVGARSSGTAGQRRLGGVLVASQVALSLVLLFAAGVLLRTFQTLSNVDPGFVAQDVVTFQVSAPRARYADAAAITRYWDAVDRGLGVLPGVRDVATADNMPFSGGGNRDVFVDKVRGDRGHDNPQVRVSVVSPTYWHALRIRVAAGRTFQAPDADSAPRVVIINRALAAKYYPGENPVGRVINWNREDWRIVGVTGTARMTNLYDDPEPELYASTTQNVRRSRFVLVKSTIPPDRLLPSIRRSMRAIDPTISINDIATLEQRVTDSVAPQRFRAALVSGLGLLALLLSIVGIYGVLAYSVNRRTREIGIRMALGEERSSVRRRVVATSLRMVAVGGAAGIVAALLVGRWLAGFVVGISPRDPAMLAAVSAVLLVAAVLAAYIPARRASRVDPLTAIRSD
jgi:putative ABC transport system permease protein